MRVSRNSVRLADISPYSGRDCVKPHRSSYTGLYPKSLGCEATFIWQRKLDMEGAFVPRHQPQEECVKPVHLAHILGLIRPVFQALRTRRGCQTYKDESSIANRARRYSRATRYLAAGAVDLTAQTPSPSPDLVCQVRLCPRIHTATAHTASLPSPGSARPPRSLQAVAQATSRISRISSIHLNTLARADVTSEEL